MGWGHKPWHNGNRHVAIDKPFIITVICICVFLYFAYQYYTKNIIDAFFTTLIMLPLIHKVVEGYVYWIIVAVISYCIWKVVDFFD